MKLLLSDVWSPQATGVWRPAVDVYRTPAGWLIKAEVAGVRLNDLCVSARGRLLTISGVRRDWMAERGCTYYALEISYARFERTIELPVEIDPHSLCIDYRDGILLVRITNKGVEKANHEA
jgi:HSP20 family protein